jgi:hypothetical protein
LQPAAAREPLKYLPRRDTISAFVLLERGKFGIRPAIKVRCKFNASGIEERPSQMIEIHGSSIEGRTMPVNPREMSPLGCTKSSDDPAQGLLQLPKSTG